MQCLSAENQTPREVVALSLSQRPRSKDLQELDNESDDDHITSATGNYNILFDHETYKQGEWCLLNIMLIEWKGSEAERVTIGQIHIDAWNQFHTERKQIRLV
jgi:hypothetical protein